MRRGDWRAIHLKPEANRMIQVIWLAFAALAVSLAAAGVPHYIDLVRTLCDGPDCFAGQLTSDVAGAWQAADMDLALYTWSQVCVLLLLDGLVLSMAAYFFWYTPHRALSMLTAFVGVALATGTLSQALAHRDPRFALPAQVILFVQIGGIVPLACLLPDGRLRSAWLRRGAVAYTSAVGVFLLASHLDWLSSGPARRAIGTGIAVAALMLVLGAVVSRIRAGAAPGGQERTRWLLAGMGLAAVALMFARPLGLVTAGSLPAFDLTLPDRYAVGMLLGALLLAGSLTCVLVAIVNFETPATHRILNHTLVFAALTAAIAAVYGLIVGYLGMLFQSGTILPPLVATGVAAVAFHPLRERVQRLVNRLMYGDRDEPYEALTRLGQRLEAAIDPTTVLPLTVETVARTLRLPYVATVLATAQERSVAAHGTPQPECERFPLVYAGETIGALVAARRMPDEPLPGADRRLLADLARQISIVAHTSLLTSELGRARMRLVMAQEETRRRLGSDLHDGLGHQLAGLARQADLVARGLADDPVAARCLLSEITTRLNGAIADVRRLAHQLHPPELELLGLVGALRERAATHTNLLVRIDAPEMLPAMPAATETAAWYIALEALSNVEKHAGASACRLRLRYIAGATPLAPAWLELEIRDNGRGLPTGAGHGLGLLSMRARAADIGGTCEIATHPDDGAWVSVRLPCLPVEETGEEE